jgi:geranylgeranyl reductase family protein
MADETFDVIIAGGGPAGAACASFCAKRGLRVLVLERESFPREKVCGDCLNPGCWPVLERLGVRDQVAGLPHGCIECVEFIGINGKSVSIDLPRGRDAEISLKRSLFDDLLLNRAKESGATVRNSCTLTALHRMPPDLWRAQTSAGESFHAKIIVAADGRNSTVARLLNCGRAPQKDRVAMQTHLRLPRDFGNRIVLQFLPDGYSGQAPTGLDQLNVCLVSRAPRIGGLKNWAQRHFDIPPDHAWRTVTPLTRAPLPPAQDSAFFIGDAARVVEPFTGEGIFYALASGELAAGFIARRIERPGDASVVRQFIREHGALYRGRLWINRLARAAVLSPRIASAFVPLARMRPSLLRFLTSKVVS